VKLKYYQSQISLIFVSFTCMYCPQSGPIAESEDFVIALLSSSIEKKLLYAPLLLELNFSCCFWWV